VTYLLGIDVGTTRTAAAISRAGGRPGEIEVFNLGDRSSAVPSVLFLGSDGAVVVGDAAERRASTDPGHVVREFKRRIGDPTPIVVGGRPWAPEELSALLVRWVADRVAQREAGGASRIAVTHPASWGTHKKDLLGAALTHHGLPVTFLAEPQAAAMQYAAGERVEPGSTIAVYDFGGGTFDAAVVHKEAGGFGLMGRPEGVERLGGVDLDEIVFEHVREGLPEAFDGLDDTDPATLAAVAAVRRECTEAKEALSADTEVSIPVLTPAGQGSVRLHRSEFEAMIRPHVEETVGALRRAVASAGLTPEQLTAVLLVGGSSRIPLVAQLVSEQLGRPVAVDADPKNAIAMGAAQSLIPPSPSGTGAFVAAPRAGVASSQPIGAAPTPPIGQVAYPQAGPAGGAPRPAIAGTGTFAAHAVAGDVDHTPPTQRISATGSLPPRMAAPMPPPRPAFADRPLVEYDHVPARSAGRTLSPALLVSVGGALAAVAIVAAAFLWPRQVVTVPIGVQNADPTPASVAPAPVTTTQAQPPVTTAPEIEAPVSRPPRATQAPAPPIVPPPATTVTPTTTMAVTPSPTPKPTTPPPTTPTTAPAPAPAPGPAPAAANPPHGSSLHRA
jgi:molecular chaperone DnaK